MRSRSLFISGLTGTVAALAFLASRAEAQQFATVKNPYTVTCASCRISLDSLFTVGSANDSLLPAQIVGFGRDGSGRFVGISFDRFALVFYNASGAYERAFGRRGDGPGEFSGPFGIQKIAVAAGDSVYAMDSRSRITVVSPARSAVREFRVSGTTVSHLNALRDGRVLTSYARSDSGFLLLSDPTGRPIRWIGRGPYSITDSLTFPRNAPLRYTQFRIAGDQQSIWVMQENSIFRIQQWNLNGNPGAAFEFINVPWMTAPHMTERPPARAGGTPYRSFEHDHGFSLLTGEINGIIWVRHWTRPQGSTTLTNRRFFLNAVDARTGRLLATQETERFFDSFPGASDLVYSAVEDANGVITRTIWRLQLTGR